MRGVLVLAALVGVATVRGPGAGAHVALGLPELVGALVPAVSGGLLDPELPRWKLERLLRGGELLAWANPMTPLLAWTEVPRWFRGAAVVTVLHSGPRWGWPRVPVALLESAAVRVGPGEAWTLAQLVRRRWRWDRERHEERAIVAAVAERNIALAMTMVRSASPRCLLERLPRLLARDWPDDRAVRLVEVWPEQVHLVREPPADDNELRALDLVATTLGCPP